MSFETSVSGKWILAGEHAVLRGSPALVFPLKSRYLKLSYIESISPLSVEFSGEHGEELQLLFWGVLEKACGNKKVKRSSLTGQMNIYSNLPVGAGMGASAALCVAVSRWLQYLKIISNEEIYEFSRNLENLFHGESSGVDIAVALSGSAIKFIRGGEIKNIEMNWTPQWYISYSGKRGVTSECVNKVKKLFETNPEKARLIDQRMYEAVTLSEDALKFKDEKLGFKKLVDSIQLAASAFRDWNLTEGALENHMRWLMDQGAVAVKPTGSGDGGYVMSLWSSAPPQEIIKKLIACN